MTAMVSVVSGGSVVHVQQFAGMQNGKAMRISAVKGARYVLAEMHGGVAGDISVKRVGKNLVIEQQKAGVEPASVVIEEFYGSEGQLVGLGADGEYLEYLAAGEGGATEASAMTDGASAQLTLAAGQPVVLPSSFALAEGRSSVFSSALAGVSALAAGVALSNNKSGGSKAQPAPAASAFVLEGQPADAAAGKPAPAAVEPDVSAVVQDAGNTAGPVAEVHSEAGDVSADNAAINDNASNANTNEDAAPVESNTAPEAEAITSPDSASNANTNENAAPAESTAAPEAEAITSPGLIDAPAAVVPFAVDDVPVIEKVMDDHGVIQGVIENGGYTDDVYPTLMGRADPGVKVHVYRGKYLQGYTVADENGVWSYTPSSAYASGTHSMTVKYEYPNKDTSGYSEPYIITIDKIAPGIPKITGILDDEGRITGAITDQTITDDNRPTITGTAEANAKLIVYDKGKQIGSTTVGADGTWSFTPDTPLADGLHMLSYSAVDRAGNSGEQTEVTEFTIDTRPEKINIYYAEDDVGSVTDEVFSGGATDDSTPTLFGTATAGGIVKIYEGSVLLGQVVADVDGTWQFTPPAELSEGAHTFHATVTLVAKGESGPSRPFKLEVDLTPPSIPTIEQVLDDVGAVQGVIENGQHTDDATPTLSGKAEVGSTVRIYDNGSLLGTALTDAKGVWTFTPAVALDEGEHMFTISATDAAGNVTASPAQYEITIDSTRPDAPKIASVLDDVGEVQGPLQNGDRTDDTRPTFLGTAEANSTVIIRDHGVEIARVQADENGQWRYTPASELATGPHGISVISVDAAGNASQPTESFDFTISLLPPSGPRITSIYDDVGKSTGELRSGAITDDDMPRVNGKGEPYSMIVLTDNGMEIGRTQVDAAGNWSFLPSSPLSLGLHNLIATEVDAHGNAVGSSNTFGFRIAAEGGAGGFENFNALSGNYNMVHLEDVTLASGVVLSGTFGGVETPFGNKPTGFRPEDGHNSLLVGYGGLMSIELPRESSTVSFYHYSNTPKGSVSYFDAHGEKLGELALTPAFGNRSQQLVFTAPEGKLVASIQVNSSDGAGGNGWSYIDALQWGERYPTDIWISNVVSNSSGDRIIYGAVADMPYLLPDMVIQVTTDGGKTWTDAVFSEGSWAVIQHKMPAGNWTAEVRIAERSSGLSLGLTHSKYARVEVVGVPVIERIEDAEGVYTTAKASDGSLVEVSLAATDAQIGDKVHIRWGTISHDQVLTRFDIAAGHVTVRMPADQLLAQGAAKDFSVTAQIIAKGGAIGGVSQAYDVVIKNAVDLRDPKLIASVKETFYGSDANDVVTLQMRASDYFSGAPGGIHGGGGIDTLKLTPGDDHIYSGLGFSSMEIIDMGQMSMTAQKSLRLDLTDVLRNGATDAFYVGDESRIQMMIKGKNGGSYFAGLGLSDTLVGGFDLQDPAADHGGDLGQWELAGYVQIGGEYYTSYRHSAVNVEVLTQGGVKVAIYNRAEFVEVGLPRGGISSLLQPAEPELFAAGGGLLNAGGAGDRGAGGVTYPAHGLNTDLFETAGGIVKIYLGRVLLGEAVSGVDGSWEFTPPAALSDGAHTFYATVSLPAKGESEPSKPFSLTVKTMPPDKPSIDQVLDDVGTVQGPLKNGDSTDDTKPTLVGKGTPGATLKVYDGNTLLGSVPVDALGNWRFTPSAALVSGSHKFTAVAVDSEGKSSEKSNAFSVTVDTSISVYKPLAVDLNGGAPQGLTQCYMIKTGSAPAQTYRVYVNGKLQDEVTLGSWVMWNSRTWWTNATTQVFRLVVVKSGYEIEVDSHTGSQLMSKTSGPDGHIMLNNQLVTYSPTTRGASGFLVDSESLVVATDTVAAESGAVNRFKDVALQSIAEDVDVDEPAISGGTERAETAVDASISTPVAEKGNASGLEDGASAVAPSASDDIPLIVKVIDNHGVIQGIIENGGYTDDVYPTLMGHADPGVKVHVYRGKFLQGYVVADENGEWSYTPSSAYASGTHSMTVKYEYPNKDTSGYSEPYIITIDKIAPGIPQITGILDNEGPITGAITNKTITDDNRPTITGTAEANAKLIVYDKDNEIGSTTVGADGTWSFTPDTPLADGLHMLKYSAVDRAGNSGEQTDVTEFVVDTRPQKIRFYHAEDDAGSVTGDVYNGGVTDDTTPTLFGTATAGGIVKIYEAGVLLGQVTADVDGTWQFTPGTALGEGTHTFHATVTLVAKGESALSQPFTLAVDSQPPAKPTIDTVADDVGSITTNVVRGGVTDDANPEFKGRSEANSTVIVKDRGVELGRVLADAHGNWIFTPGSALSDSAHSITATAVDAVGHVSESSDVFNFTVDTLPPAKPTIVKVIDDVGSVTGNVAQGANTDDAQPDFQGKAEANSTVIIKDGSVELGRVRADAGSNWAFTPGNKLSDGAHNITVTAVDAAGNTSQNSDSYSFTVTEMAVGIERFYEDGHTQQLTTQTHTFKSGLHVNIETWPTVVGGYGVGYSGGFVIVENETYHFTLPSLSNSLSMDFVHLNTLNHKIQLLGADGKVLQTQWLLEAYAPITLKFSGALYSGFRIIAGEEVGLDMGFQIDNVAWGGAKLKSLTGSAPEAESDALVHTIDSSEMLSPEARSYAEGDGTIIAGLGLNELLAGIAGNDVLTNVGAADVVQVGLAEGIDHNHGAESLLHAVEDELYALESPLLNQAVKAVSGLTETLESVRSSVLEALDTYQGQYAVY